MVGMPFSLCWPKSAFICTPHVCFFVDLPIGTYFSLVQRKERLLPSSVPIRSTSCPKSSNILAEQDQEREMSKWENTHGIPVCICTLCLKKADEFHDSQSIFITLDAESIRRWDDDDFLRTFILQFGVLGLLVPTPRALRLDQLKLKSHHFSTNYFTPQPPSQTCIIQHALILPHEVLSTTEAKPSSIIFQVVV